MRMFKVVNVLLVSFQFALLPSLVFAKDKHKKKKEKKYKEEKIHIVHEKVEKTDSECSCSKFIRVLNKKTYETDELHKKVVRPTLERVELTKNSEIMKERFLELELETLEKSETPEEKELPKPLEKVTETILEEKLEEIVVEVETVRSNIDEICIEKEKAEEKVDDVIELIVEKVVAVHSETKQETQLELKSTHREDKTFCLDREEYDFTEYGVSSLCFTIGMNNNITHVSASIHM